MNFLISFDKNKNMNMHNINSLKNGYTLNHAKHVSKAIHGQVYVIGASYLAFYQSFIYIFTINLIIAF